MPCYDVRAMQENERERKKLPETEAMLCQALKFIKSKQMMGEFVKEFNQEEAGLPWQSVVNWSIEHNRKDKEKNP